MQNAIETIAQIIAIIRPQYSERVGRGSAVGSKWSRVETSWNGWQRTKEGRPFPITCLYIVMFPLFVCALVGILKWLLASF